MSNLAQGGTISYNGYSFQGPRNSVQLEIIPQRDSTGRYVTHNVYRFSIDTWITADTNGVTGDGSSASTHLTQIRGALSQDGGALTISGFGFGDITVNTGGSDRDIDFGPKTQLLRAKPIGNGCIVLVWIVEARLKTCTGGTLSGIIGTIKEYVYSVRWTIKPNGCTVRIVEGHLEIFANTAVARGTGIAVTADNYREQVFVPIPAGFYRSQPQEYHLEANKARLRFRVVDEEPESDNIFPLGVAHMEFEHTVNSNLFGGNTGSAKQESVFSGQIEMARPYPNSLAWTRAVLLMQERLVHATNTTGAPPLITFVSITESVFRRRISFMVKYFIQATSLKAMVLNAGLFNDVASTDIRSYTESMQLAWANRGTARLMHDPSSEQLPDQCGGNQQITITDQIAPYFLSGSTGAIFTECPSEALSYLVYENFIDYHTASTSLIVQQMPTSVPSPSAAGAGEVMPGFRLAQVTESERAKRRTQTIGDGKPRIQICIRGRAYRIGFAPEIPKLANVFGKTAQYNSSGSTQTITQTGFYGECPIYAATWYLLYDVEFTSASELKAATQNGITGAVYDTDSSTDPKTKAKSL